MTAYKSWFSQADQGFASTYPPDKPRHDALGIQQRSSILYMSRLASPIRCRAFRVRVQVAMCLRIADAGHRPGEYLHVALLHVLVAVGHHRTEFDHGSGRRERCGHQSCAIEFPASLVFEDHLDGIVDFLERRLDGVAKKSGIKPRTGQRPDAGMNERPEPIGRVGRGINIGLLSVSADFREDEALHLLHPLDRRPLEG